MAGALQPCSPTHLREDARGLFVEVVNTGPWETVITATMRPGSVIGNHYHKRTRIFLYLVSGAADVHVTAVDTGERQRCQLKAGQGTYLEPYQAHAIHFEAESTFLLLKSRRYNKDDPDTYPFSVLEDKS